MDEYPLRSQLSGLPLGPLRYFDNLGSTNQEAARWAEAGASHLSLVVADEQTAGRGRLGRRWFTPPGAALAFSLILRSEEMPFITGDPGQASAEIYRFAQNDKKNAQDDEKATQDESLAANLRLAGLGALAVCMAVEEADGLRPQIKWPNDVLLGGRKVCGVLPELIWRGELLDTAVLGIGINVAPHSVPPAREVRFPATCMESELGRKIDRWGLLRQVLAALLDWLPRLASPEFLQAWEDRLAYRGDRVLLEGSGGQLVEGRLLGLDLTGSLRLQLASGPEVSFRSGELSLRPGAFQS